MVVQYGKSLILIFLQMKNSCVVVAVMIDALHWA